MRDRSALWTGFVARRFATVNARGRSALTSVLATLGIAFGVMALIVILSVMNGFQMGYIESILEVSSSHVQLDGTEAELRDIARMDGVRALSVYSEAQTLMRGAYGRQQGVLVRFVQPDLAKTDEGFAKSAEVIEGSFDVAERGTAVLGYYLAQLLGVGVGDTVSVLAVSGDSSTDIFPEDADLVITGLVRTGYYAIDSTYAFVSRNSGLIGDAGETVHAGVKLDDLNRDRQFIERLSAEYPDVRAESWRTYNRSFFGALQIEKNVLLMLVVLIFAVVTVNIYNSMRKSVYERRDEISVLSALGARPAQIRAIFVAGGLGIGLSGGMLGLLSGMFLTVRINSVFTVAEAAVNALNRFASALLGVPPGQQFALFSPEYFYMNEIPARMFFPEVLFVFLFGVVSAGCAAWMASRSIVQLKPAEVLRYE
jgi:lipoprotein-releasing system permease protein